MWEHHYKYLFFPILPSEICHCSYIRTSGNTMSCVWKQCKGWIYKYLESIRKKYLILHPIVGISSPCLACLGLLKLSLLVYFWVCCDLLTVSFSCSVNKAQTYFEMFYKLVSFFLNVLYTYAENSEQFTLKDSWRHSLLALKYNTLIDHKKDGTFTLMSSQSADWCDKALNLAIFPNGEIVSQCKAYFIPLQQPLCTRAPTYW